MQVGSNGKKVLSWRRELKNALIGKVWRGTKEKKAEGWEEKILLINIRRRVWCKMERMRKKERAEYMV